MSVAMPRRSSLLVLLTLSGVAVGFLVTLLRPGREEMLAYDVYNYFLPNMVYATHSVYDHGRGLLWNPFQNCGQPFFGVSTNGLLSPPYLLFLVLRPDHALAAVLAINVTLVGVWAYLFGRELNLRPLAALCGALALELGNATADLVTFTPALIGSYAWLPAAMLLCERLLRQPSWRTGALLSMVLAMELLPGHPQVVLFTYQFIALRIGWDLITRGRRVWPSIGPVAFALLLAPALIAIQFVPGIETARESIRNANLGLAEISPLGFMTWQSLREIVSRRSEIGNPLMLASVALAAGALFNRVACRISMFYALAAVFFFVLSFGPNGKLYLAYMWLPFGTLFRDPVRFNWLTVFCLATLAGFGAEAIIDASRHPGRVARWIFPILPMLGCIAYYFFSPIRFLRMDWIVAGLIAAAVCIGLASVRAQTLAGLAIALAVVLDFQGRPIPFRRLQPAEGILLKHAEFFSALRQRMTPQDRAFFVTQQSDFRFQQKTASVFGVPAIHEYDAQPPRRYSELFAMMLNGVPMKTLADLHYQLAGWTPPFFRRSLLDLTAAHYVVARESVDETARVKPPFQLLLSGGGIRLYENTQALPRAYYVPQIDVVADPPALLQRLASLGDERRRIALVESEPASGFKGVPGNTARGEVTFLRNDPEHVELEVTAPARGFLVLADEFFPGWYATVNGVAAPISRANYAFRVVEVPMGASKVEFRFVPASVKIGAAVSAAAFTILVFALRRSDKPTAC